MVFIGSMLYREALSNTLAGHTTWWIADTGGTGRQYLSCFWVHEGIQKKWWSENGGIGAESRRIRGRKMSPHSGNGHRVGQKSTPNEEKFERDERDYEKF